MKHLFKPLFSLIVAAGVMVQPCLAQESNGPQGSKTTHTVDIKAEDYSFQAPDEIVSGWTTIKYENAGEESHFLLLTRIPDEVTYDEYVASILPPFNDIWYALRDGEIDQEQAVQDLGAQLPEWFWSVEFMGGAGITPAGSSSEIVLNLKPGTYVIECYMKTEDGEIHSMEGMVRKLIVTDASSTTTPPEADIRVTLSNFDMNIEGELTSGSHMVAVHVAEQPEEGFGHNLHVARVGEDTETGDMLHWINFFNVEGLQTPGPATFAGGIHLMPEDYTGYFKLDLEPGRYIFISEYTGHLGVIKEVTVK